MSKTKNKFFKSLALFLPGIFLLGFNIGTGSVTSMAKAGATYGMSLLWTIVASCLATFFMWQKTFKEKYNHFQKNRGYSGTVKTRNLLMINQTLPTSVYVELGNIQNSYDRKRLVFDDNREALAKWLYEGIRAAQL